MKRLVHLVVAVMAAATMAAACTTSHHHAQPVRHDRAVQPVPLRSFDATRAVYCGIVAQIDHIVMPLNHTNAAPVWADQLEPLLAQLDNEVPVNAAFSATKLSALQGDVQDFINGIRTEAQYPTNHLEGEVYDDYARDKAALPSC